MTESWGNSNKAKIKNKLDNLSLKTNNETGLDEIFADGLNDLIRIDPAF
ncbi:hypothetical protein ATS73_013065 [Pseudoalteromonas sp. H100]|nr:hypothetical protein [Pseudoalteromonas sp. H100]WFO18942.1 hypothetical protein ATS73_013065 [Pseudoalteromonas sp. H100]